MWYPSRSIGYGVGVRAKQTVVRDRLSKRGVWGQGHVTPGTLQRAAWPGFACLFVPVPTLLLYASLVRVSRKSGLLNGRRRVCRSVISKLGEAE